MTHSTFSRKQLGITLLLTLAFWLQVKVQEE